MMLYLSANSVPNLGQYFNLLLSVPFLNTTYLKSTIKNVYYFWQDNHVCVLTIIGINLSQKPVERKLGQTFFQLKQSRTYIKIVNDHVYEVSLLQSLKHLLANPTIFEEVRSKFKLSYLKKYALTNIMFICSQIIGNEMPSVQWWIFSILL